MRFLDLVVPVCFCASVASAQVDRLPIETRVVQVDSGYRDHLSTKKKVIFREDVVVRGAAWMRLFFDRTNLPEGSELRMTAKRDGAVQRHDARTLLDYGESSAYFNGDRVTVELIAAPGTRANRVLVNRVEFLFSGGSGPESICGTTDDRKLSNDKRVGRAVSGSSACTWWLIDEFTVLTAGHCASNTTSTAILGFNIPLSTSSGTYVQPPPSDQYPLDRATLRYGTGLGSDWAVIAARRNSNHGQYPGQRQGSWFKIGPVPSSPSGVNIRITGNGRVSSPVSPTWNAVQKTHVGPCVRTSSYLRYRTDTSGGNSGSPVIHENTGEAIGIHTHGGCTTTGGQNSGTRIDLSALRTAIQAVRASKVAGSLEVFGQGCGVVGGQPTLSMSGFPDVGGQIEVRIGGLPSGKAGLLFIGASDKTWNGASLPFDLGVIGFKGCLLHISIDVQVSLPTGSGVATQKFAIPSNSSLINTAAFLQYAAASGGTQGAVFSNAGKVYVGG